MNHSQVKEIVEKSIHDSHNYNFMVTMANGDKKKMRMFISVDGGYANLRSVAVLKGGAYHVKNSGNP